jgi:uncharacterized membrane protein
MTENEKTNFAGTYFDRDSVLRLARLADNFAWITLAYYVAQSLVAATIFVLQFVRGFSAPVGFTDIAQQLIWAFQPVIPGLLNFLGIQAIGKFLLILMDIEDNLRRAARNRS